MVQLVPLPCPLDALETSTKLMDILSGSFFSYFMVLWFTETIRLIRDRQPKTAASTFTQLLSSEGLSSVFLYVHRNNKAYQGLAAQNGSLDFHTAPEL